jgi:hypothetical protein
MTDAIIVDIYSASGDGQMSIPLRADGRRSHRHGTGNAGYDQLLVHMTALLTGLILRGVY